MREIITIHIGQAGIQAGNTCWELYCLEHGLKNNRHFSDDNSPYDDNFTTFFAEIKENEFVPRALFIDLEPTTIDEIKTGINKEQYLPEQFIFGKEDAANIYARGYYSIGKELIDISLEKIRKIAENCTRLQGFIIFNSVGGGTGSGFGSLLLEQLSAEYSKNSKMNLTIFPSPKLSTSIVEPYNSVLATHKLIEHSDMTLAFENEAIWDICKQQLYFDRPTYKNINNIIAQVASAMTANIRFEGYSNDNLYEIHTNLCPYPRMHFILSSYAPFHCSERVLYEIPWVSDITELSFTASNMMVKCDPQQGKATAYNLMYRGDVIPKDISKSVASLKTRGVFRNSSQAPGFLKCGINYTQPKAIPGSNMTAMLRNLLSISNHSAINQMFARINKDFDLMHRKKAFLHWYNREGMEEEEFYEARQDMLALEKDYEDTTRNINEVEAATQ